MVIICPLTTRLAHPHVKALHASGCQVLSIRTQAHGEKMRRGTQILNLPAPLRLLLVHIPDPNRPVPTTRDESPSVRGEGNRLEQRIVPAQAACSGTSFLTG